MKSYSSSIHQTKPYDSNMVRDCFLYEWQFVKRFLCGLQYLLLLQVYDTLKLARMPTHPPSVREPMVSFMLIYCYSLIILSFLFFFFCYSSSDTRCMRDLQTKKVKHFDPEESTLLVHNVNIVVRSQYCVVLIQSLNISAVC